MGEKADMNPHHTSTNQILRLFELDRKHLWHPYTQMKDYEKRDPLFVKKAEGIYLYDIHGRKYFDTISSWWCILHGHNHPRIKQAICDQLNSLEQIHFAGTTHEGAIRLAGCLAEITPPELTRVFFSDDGSTACEVAIKMSLQYWKQSGAPQRELFVSLEHGYHGDTIGAMSLGGVPAFKGPFDCLTFSSPRIPAPYCYRCPASMHAGNCDFQCLEPLEHLLEKEGERIAGIILEPMMMGAGGMIMYPAGYLRRLSDICRGHHMHIIFDEVATGFGRTGKMFALEHAGVTPDFLCISKGLTAGVLPLAATLTTEQIYSAFYADYTEGRTFFHGHTFTANPLGCAAALASLRVFREEGVMEALPARVKTLQEGKDRFAELENVGDARGIGMVAAFELVKDKAGKTPFDPAERVGWKIYLKGLEQGLILRPLGDVIYLLLPLCTTKDEIELILEKTYGVLDNFFKQP